MTVAPHGNITGICSVAGSGGSHLAHYILERTILGGNWASRPGQDMQVHITRAVQSSQGLL